MFARPARAALVTALTALAVVGVGPQTSPAEASVTPVPGSTMAGADISWPNCPVGEGIPQRPTEGRPMPPAGSTFAVVGLTNGPGFYPNPCLASEFASIRARHLWLGVYSNSSYPTRAQLATYGGTGTLATRLYRTGLAEARFNLASMHRAGLATAPMMWMDVEPVNNWPWSGNAANNNHVIDGIIAGYHAAHMSVGIYSYRYGWGQITGGRRFPGLPTWVPLGHCSDRSFSGGPVWMTQTVSGHSDLDALCPGLTGTPARVNPLTQYEYTRIARGSTGSAVVAAQKRLGVPADGHFGPVTESAVRSFQKAHGLAQNGVVDTPVWKAMGAGGLLPPGPSLLPHIFLST